MDSRDSVAQALAARDGRLVAVGSNEDVSDLIGPRTQVIDLEGRVTLPGLTDCHVHLASDAGVHAVECRDLYVPAIRRTDDLLATLRRAAEATPAGTWIIGRGSPMQDTRIEERRWPTLAELDSAVPHHPCYLTFGAHIVVANSRALQERGITRDTPSPQGGTVVKDPHTGEPTGLLRERAQYLMKDKAIQLEPEALAECILAELETCLRRGVTSLHDIVTTREEVLAYQLLARAERLPVRVQMIVRVIESNFEKRSLLDLGLLHGFGSDWLKLGGIKMSVDGGFTGKNAAFSEPLATPGEHNPGLIRITQDELDETVEMYHAAGMRICTHAMGDQAVDMALAAYERALARHPRADHRHRVEHMGNWVMVPERIARAKRLGIIPVANPSFLYFFGDPSVDMLGERITRSGFPFRSMLDAGLPVSFGSDAPGYFPIDPLRDLGSAIGHCTLSGRQVNPAEGLSPLEALRCQTATAAYLGFEERRLGTLEPGKLADVTVLDADPFTYPPDRFRELPVAYTITGGQVRFFNPSALGGAVWRDQLVGSGMPKAES
jgi:predicted amidohydrolase YtcJ